LSLGAKEKVLKHDLKLIEGKNMKILCKNIIHGCADNGVAPPLSFQRSSILQRAWHRSCLQAHGRARQLPPFV